MDCRAVRYARLAMTRGARVTSMTWLFQWTGGGIFICAVFVGVLRVCRRVHNARTRWRCHQTTGCRADGCVSRWARTVRNIHIFFHHRDITRWA